MLLLLEKIKNRKHKNKIIINLPCVYEGVGERGGAPSLLAEGYGALTGEKGGPGRKK